MLFHSRVPPLGISILPVKLTNLLIQEYEILGFLNLMEDQIPSFSGSSKSGHNLVSVSQERNFNRITLAF